MYTRDICVCIYRTRDIMQERAGGGVGSVCCVCKQEKYVYVHYRTRHYTSTGWRVLVVMCVFVCINEKYMCICRTRHYTSTGWRWG
jgi:hypothetical protein